MARIDAEGLLFDYVERFRDLLTTPGWQRLMLDLSKNDLLALLFLHRHPEARMSDLADHLHSPLNTATGVVARLQRRGLVERHHSPEDKRVVVVALSTEGRSLIREGLREWLSYAERVTARLTDAELAAVLSAVDRVLEVLREDAGITSPTRPPARRIPID